MLLLGGGGGFLQPLWSQVWVRTQLDKGEKECAVGDRGAYQAIAEPKGRTVCGASVPVSVKKERRERVEAALS